jgi:cell division protein FtsA
MGLGIPYDVAEEAKIRFGDVTPGYREARNVTLGEDGHIVSCQEIHSIITARIEEIFRLIMADILSYESDAVAPTGLVLTGGTANLAGIEALGEEMAGFPVQVRLPQGMSGPADILYDPAYAASVGLLFWGARHADEGCKSQEIRPPGYSLGGGWGRY